MSEGPNLAAQQQAMNHGKGGGGVALDLNSVFGRNADGADAIMRGHGVDEAVSHMKQIMDEFFKNASSGGGGEGGGGGGSTASVGMGGGADALTPMGAGAPMSPSYTEMVSPGGKGGRSGGWGLGEA